VVLLSILHDDDDYNDDYDDDFIYKETYPIKAFTENHESRASSTE
jgi:hypothetical protein